MNKKGIILLSSILCLASVSAVALTSMSNSELLHADSPKTEAQYTITQWDLVGQLSNFWFDDENNAGFFFTPHTGRRDFVLGIIVQSKSQHTIEDEELTFEQTGTYISYRSYRKWYYNQYSVPRTYSYEDDVDHMKSLHVARMTYVIGTYDGENFNLENRPDNFSETSISVYSAFAYTYMDTPTASEIDFNNWRVFDSYKTRTFTPNNPVDDDVYYEHYAYEGNDVCVGFQIDYASLSLTYGCSY